MRVQTEQSDISHFGRTTYAGSIQSYNCCFFPRGGSLLRAQMLQTIGRPYTSGMLQWTEKAKHTRTFMASELPLSRQHVGCSEPKKNTTAVAHAALRGKKQKTPTYRHDLLLCVASWPHTKWRTFFSLLLYITAYLGSSG